MILIDNTFLTSIGIVGGNTQSVNQYEFHLGLEMDDTTVYNRTDFFKEAKVNGIKYNNQYEFYKAIGEFYSLPIYDEYSFMLNSTFDGINPIVSQYEYYKTVGSLLGGTSSPPAWAPDDVAGLNLWFQRSDTSSFNGGGISVGQQVNSWGDKSTNSYDMTQVTSTKQPIYGATAVSFDGVDDDLNYTIANAFGTHTMGTMMFSLYVNTEGGTKQSYSVVSADTAINNNFIIFGVRQDGKPFIQVNNGGGTSFKGVQTDDTFNDGDYIYVTIRSNSVAWTVRVNGSDRATSLIPGSVGTNDGTWFSGISNRDNLSLGAMLRSSQVFRPSKLDKIIYYDSFLTGGDLTDAENWISNPNT